MHPGSKLLHNRWFGKALGILISVVFAPRDPTLTIFWVVCGIGIGHGFDLWSTRFLHPTQLGRLWRRLKPKSVDSRPSMQFTFAAMGRIAKSGGKVLPAHIDYAEQLMSRLGFGGVDRRQAIEWFSAGKEPDFPFVTLANECSTESSTRPVLREMVIECMCRAAAITDDDNSRQSLAELATLLGVPAPTLTMTYRAIVELNDVPPAALDAAYETLCAEPEWNAEKIKKAYRRLISRYHPDRLGSASKRTVRRAERRMVELREALETIQSAR